jgi:hypothetical protein
MHKGVREDNEAALPYEELHRDVTAGIDAISRFSEADWWVWIRGSALFFWRWPKGEQRTWARNSTSIWV